MDDWHRFFVQTTYDAAAKVVEDLDPAEVELAKVRPAGPSHAQFPESSPDDGSLPL